MDTKEMEMNWIKVGDSPALDFFIAGRAALVTRACPLMLTAHALSCRNQTGQPKRKEREENGKKRS